MNQETRDKINELIDSIIDIHSPYEELQEKFGKNIKDITKYRWNLYVSYDEDRIKCAHFIVDLDWGGDCAVGFIREFKGKSGRKYKRELWHESDNQ
jgi:hypothetical protein